MSASIQFESYRGGVKFIRLSESTVEMEGLRMGQRWFAHVDMTKDILLPYLCRRLGP